MHRVSCLLPLLGVVPFRAQTPLQEEGMEVLQHSEQSSYLSRLAFSAYFLLLRTLALFVPHCAAYIFCQAVLLHVTYRWHVVTEYLSQLV